MQNKFSEIYSKNIWGSSGSGSKFTNDNKFFLNELRNHIDKYDLKTIGDVGCGDWNIMRHFELKSDESYTGIDCVDFLINDLKMKSEEQNIDFTCLDISKNIPVGYDIIVIKDVIQHWEDKDILEFIPKLLKNNKYVYCVNGYKFGRDKTKSNWTTRHLDKKYKYHPISIIKEPMNKFNYRIMDIKHRRCKEYILLSN